MRISHDAPPTGIPATAAPFATAPRPAGPARPDPLDYGATLALLRDELGFDVAPHVAAHLTRRLRGDRDGIRETAGILTPAQLRGRAALPDPLPLVPAVTSAWGPAIGALDDAARRALLVACISVSHRTDTLLAATGLPVGDIIGEPLSPFLELVSGHFVVRDPRIRCAIHESATLAERTAAHALLADALAGAGRPGLAAWHSALATLEGDSRLAPELLALSRAALRRGDSIWAFHVAREAASQAEGDDQARADLQAGISALLSGYLDDAVYSLGRVARCRIPGLVRRALAPYVIAVTLSTGYVPDAELAAQEAAFGLAPNEDSDQDSAVGIVAALSAAAVLHAERGDDDAALDSLARAERLAATGHTGSIDSPGSATGYLAVARSWCTTYGIEAGPLPVADPATIEPRWLAGYLVASTSIALARTGDIPRAEATLSATRLRLSRDTARAVDGGPEVAATPLLEAHLDCAAALVAIAAGRYSSAARALEQAAFDGPVSLAFGGVAVAAGTRMQVLTTGHSPASAEPQLTPALRRATLIDRAFVHAFAGRPAEAAPLVALANEQGAGRLELMLPEPDECVLWADAGQPAPADNARRNLVRRGLVNADEPDSGTSWLVSLRAALALGSAHEVGRLRDAAAETCRGLASVYERAQTELVLSRALDRAGDADAARTHAVAAIELFFQTGATALVTHARTVLAAGPVDVGGAVAADWSAELTEREREVAALVVLGTSNRDAARQLHLSVRTVEVHLARVFTKLDVHSRTELSYLVHGGRERPRGRRDDRA